MLSDIEHGDAKPDDLLREIGNTVSDIVQAERQRTSRTPVTRKVVVGICPRCGRKVCKNSKGFSCEAGKDKCRFFIYGQDKRIGRSYTAAEIRELLSTGKVTLKNCTSSKGNKYSAVFTLDDTGQYVNLRLVEFVNDKKRRTAG
jgi:DNA topoisomerase-3